MGLNKVKKNIFIRTLVLLFSCLIIQNERVNAGEIDLQLRIDLNISDGVELFDTGKFVVSLTNYGPDDAGLLSTLNLPISVFSTSVLLAENGFLDVSIGKDITISQPCNFSTIVAEPTPNGGQVSFSFGIHFPIIPVNNSIICYGTYHIGFNNRIRTLNWLARSFTDNDVNLGNESVEIEFRIRPRIIPTLNINSLLILLISILLIVKYFYKSNLKTL